jgi:hypothetical protein
MSPTDTFTPEFNDSHNISSGLLTLSQAAKRLPRVHGRRLHVSTLWRWCRKGHRGIFLQYVRLGRAIMVSEAMLNRFFIALAEADNVEQHPQGISTQKKNRRTTSIARRRSLDEANATLVRAGIIRPTTTCSLKTESQLDQTLMTGRAK